MDLDILLIQRMKSGDDTAIERFVRKYYPQILQYCRLHIHDPGHAEDLTQETFERFFRSLRQYQPYGKPANYLYAIAANNCRDYYRRKKDELLTETLPEPEDRRMEHLEQWMDLRAALRTLSPEFREVAILFFLQERKQKEIARILGIGLPLVKYRIRKIREKLRELI